MMDANEDRKVQAAFDGQVTPEEAARLKQQVDKYGITLMAIAAGCAGPREAATEVLAKFGVKL